MKPANTPRRHSRGFTLIELLVVVAVVASLAAILIPKMPDLLNRANNTTMLSNLTEVDRMMLSYQAMKGGVYADGYDSMVNSTGALYTGLPGGATGSLSTSLLASTTLTAQQVARLAKIGITTVQTMKDDATVGFGATMFAYSTTGFTYSNPQTISTTTKLPFLVLSGAGAYTLGGMKFNLDATHAYVVLAVGQACSLVGPNGWIKEAPVIRHSDGCVDPEKAYCRAAVIFDLGAPVAGRDTFLPKYVGAIALGATSFKFSEELINVPERML